jgi:hypothetical protein
MSYNLGALFPGMEVISFQNESKLGKDLEAIFQKVLDYKETIDYSRCGPSDEEKRIYKINKVLDYATSYLIPAFKKVVFEDTGLTCNSVNMVGGPEVGITNTTGICICISELTVAANQRQGVATGDILRRAALDNRVETINLYKELADCIDLNKSQLTRTHLSDGRLITTPFVNMDVNVLFLLEEFVPASVAEPFTAKEITAIFLHEVGHIMTFIEHAADTYVITERIKKIAVNTDNIKTIKDANDWVDAYDKKIIPDLQKQLAKLTSAQIPDPRTIKPLKDTLAAIVSVLSTIKSILRGAAPVVNAVYTVSVIFLSAVNVVFRTLSAIVTGVFTLLMQYSNTSMAYAAWHADGIWTKYGTKVADKRSTKNNAFLAERWADEFATRHGYGDELISALAKMGKAQDYGRVVVASDSTLVNSGIISAIVATFAWLCTTFNPITRLFFPSNYEDDFYRARRVVQNMKQRFKEEKIPAIQCDALLAQLDRAEKLTAANKSIQHTSVFETLRNILDNVIDPFAWIEMLKDGKLDRDFAILQNSLDDLSSNKLYVLSHQLSRL